MNVTLHRRSVRILAALLTLTALTAACGKSDDSAEKGAATKHTGTAKKHPATEPEVTDPDEGLANAVIVGKTAAPVNLKYDVPKKPEVGQPFEVELTFLTRLPADVLEATITGMPGLTVVNGGAARFEPIEASGRYTTKVLAQANASGLYYIGIVANVQTKVQTESRTFSVPVVVGKVTAANKPEPAKDAAGEPIESMPATEQTEKTEQTGQTDKKP